MINSIHVENFRCFKTLDLESLGKYNILVGDNGSGKTALLEAIFLPGNDAQMPMVFRQLRGMVTAGFSQEKESYESLYADLFYGFSVDSDIKISLTGSQENSRQAKLFYTPISEMPLFPDDKSKNTKLANKIFTLEATDFDNSTYTAKLNLDGNFHISGRCRVQKSVFAASSGIPNPREIAQRFSNLKHNSDDDFQLMLESIYKLFPHVSDLSILLTDGSGEIYCKVDGVSRLMPISLASNGLNRILNNLLLFPSQRNGVVLIDEIENGIYYKRYPELWGAILKFCRTFDSQLFVSTHSKECLEALIPHLEKEKSSFRLIRTEHERDGRHTAKIFDGKDFESALKVGIDPRETE